MDTNKKNILRRKRIAAIALTSILATTTLIGCNKTPKEFDFKMTFNKAIIFNGNRAAIVEIKSWTDYEGEQYQIQTKDGLYILTSSYDTKLIDDRDSTITAEDLARSIKGEDVEIIYLNETYERTR